LRIATIVAIALSMGTAAQGQLEAEMYTGKITLLHLINELLRTNVV